MRFRNPRDLMAAGIALSIVAELALVVMPARQQRIALLDDIASKEQGIQLLNGASESAANPRWSAQPLFAG